MKNVFKNLRNREYNIVMCIANIQDLKKRNIESDALKKELSTLLQNYDLYIEECKRLGIKP